MRGIAKRRGSGLPGHKTIAKQIALSWVVA